MHGTALEVLHHALAQNSGQIFFQAYHLKWLKVKNRLINN